MFCSLLYFPLPLKNTSSVTLYLHKFHNKVTCLTAVSAGLADIEGVRDHLREREKKNVSVGLAKRWHFRRLHPDVHYVSKQASCPSMFCPTVSNVSFSFCWSKEPLFQKDHRGLLPQDNRYLTSSLPLILCLRMASSGAYPNKILSHHPPTDRAGLYTFPSPKPKRHIHCQRDLVKHPTRRLETNGNLVKFFWTACVCTPWEPVDSLCSTHTPLERLYLHPRRTFALVSVAIGGLEKASRVPRTKKTASVCISRTGWQEETIASKTAFVHPTGNPTEPMDLFSSLAEPDIEWRSFRFVWISSTGFGNGRGGQRLSGGSLAVMAWTPMRSLVKRKTMIGQDGMSLWDQKKDAMATRSMPLFLFESVE